MRTIEQMAKNQDDFLRPLLDMMNRRMDGLEEKIDVNTTATNRILQQTRDTNTRLTGAEASIKRLEQRGFKKINLEPNVIYLLALAAVVFLAIIASILHINLGGVLR